MTTRTAAVRVAFVSLLAATGCHNGKNPGVQESRYALEGRVGTYDDGSGRAGLAILATLRDASGAGPDVTWRVDARDASGGTIATLEYPVSGSYTATWFAAVAPSVGDYELVAAGSGEDARTPVSLPAGSGIPLPVPVLASDASRIDWTPVEGAASYLCRVYALGQLTLESSSATPGCELLGLPAGAYSASILALSVDLGAVAASGAERPELGARFDVSEARIGFNRTDGTAPPALIRAAAGAYDDGIGSRSLAVWLSITDPSGVPTSSPWNVQVVGPNLPPSAPLALTYWGNFPRLMAWAPGLPATPGVYTLTAQSGTSAATIEVSLGEPAWIDPPFAVTASDAARGGAAASWAAVTGARAYLAAAYDAVTGDLVASQWSAGTSTSFPAETFVAGRSYDVFVSATDADMVYGAVPTQVSIAENVFEYATFTAR